MIIAISIFYIAMIIIAMIQTHAVRNLWGKICYMVREAYWWVQYRINSRHRYHMVATGLPPGYYDKDDLMLHACFNLLKRFVEVEKPFDHFDTEEETHKYIWVEIKFLYEWWTITRPNKQKEHEENHWATWDQQEENKEDNTMLIRLMHVRCHLWT